MKYNRYAYSLLCAILVMCCIGNRAYSQVGITPTYGGCGIVTSLTATLTGDIPTSSGITVDDGYSGSIPIGFTFNFYGNNYNNLFIGSNGVLTFGTGLAGAYCPWPISAPLLGNSSMYNSICGPWSDILLSAGGTITYSTVGTAPFRKFMVTWCATHMYGCTAQYETFQIIIYETTNIAETHIAHRTFAGCTWNGPYAIVGVQNSTGTAATVAPGRDFPALWAAVNEGWRFTPVGAGASYTCTSIPCAPVPYASSAIYWYDSTTNTYIGTGSVLPITPVAGHTYKAGALGCSDTSFAYFHVDSSSSPSGLTGAATVHSFTSVGPSYCGACDGSIRLLGGLTPGIADTVYYSLGGIPQPPVYTSAAPDSSITLTGLCAGVYSNMYVHDGSPCPSNIVGPATLVNPPFGISYETPVNPSECGLCNGSITIHGLLPGHNITISYVKNGTPQAPVTAMAATDSTIVLTGLCAGNYTSILATMGTCTANGADITLVENPISITGEDVTSPTECGKCDGTIKLHGLYPAHPISVSFMRNGVPQAAVVVTSASDSTVLITNLCAGAYTSIIATMNGACSASAPDALLVDPVLTAGFTFVTHLGCNGDTVVITNSSSPTGYISTWTYGDGLMDSAAYSPMHVYATQGTYNILLNYHNIYGCSVTSTLPVTFNHPISSVFTATTPVCLGVPVAYTNTSVPAGATYYWTFGDGSTSTDMNPIHTYLAGGDYVTQLTVTDNIPCSVTSSVPVQVIAITARTEFHDTIVCLRDSMQLFSFVTVIPSSASGVTYQWAPNNNLSDPTAAQPMFFGPFADYTYTFTATTNLLGCAASDVENIHVKPPLILTHVTTDQSIALGSSVQLNADSALYYVWSPNDGTLDNPNINNPVATPTDSVTTYMVIGTTMYGCKDTAYVTVRVDPAVTDFMPAAFTPNGDGLNDYFKVFNMKFQKLVDFRIFNRWGQEVFQTVDPKKGWDGTFNGQPQDMGVYSYQVIVAHPDGGQKSYTGTVTLIR